MRSRQITIIDLGRTHFADAWEQQLHFAQQARALHQGFLLCTEHYPTVTLGRRAQLDSDQRDHLARNQVAVHSIGRGGLATYHGPGQIVIYAMIPLTAWKIKLRCFICALEQAMVHTCAQLHLPATAGSGQSRPVGCWVGDKKIGAIGVAVQRGITTHGLAFNVAVDLHPYQWIDPCGLGPNSIASLDQLLKTQPAPALTMEAVQPLLLAQLCGLLKAC